MGDYFKPRVLFYNFGSQMGGAEKVLLEFLKADLDRISPKVLLNEDGQFYAELDKHKIPVDILSGNIKSYTHLRRERMNILQLLSSVPNLIYIVILLIRYIKDTKNHIIVTNTFKSHLLVGFIAFFMKIKVIWRFHDILQTEYSANKFSLVNIFLLKLASIKVKIISVVSRAVKTSFIKYNFPLHKVSVINNGLNTTQLQQVANNRNRETIHIGWIGRFTPWKGIEEFIELAIRLINSDIDRKIQFIIAGGAIYENVEYESVVKEKVDKYKLFFHFLGHIRGIDRFYNDIDILIHTSTAPDPFPTTILEAGLRKKVVFASNLGGTNEMLIEGKTGFLFDISDYNSITTKIIDVIRNYEKYTPLGEQLSETIKAKFSHDKYVSSFENAILGIL